MTDLVVTKPKGIAACLQALEEQRNADIHSRVDRVMESLQQAVPTETNAFASDHIQATFCVKADLDKCPLHFLKVLEKKLACTFPDCIIEVTTDAHFTASLDTVTIKFFKKM